MKNKIIIDYKTPEQEERETQLMVMSSNGKLFESQSGLDKANDNKPRTEEEINKMIEEASLHYGKFLEAVGFNYKKDRQTIDTPKRVAKSWLKDLIIGSVTEAPEMAVFPNDDDYHGIVIQSGIRVNSICCHHNLPFYGFCSVAYVPGKKVVGLSKLNRIVDWYARRPQLQEALTSQIHKHLSVELKCPDVAVSISSKHLCCGNRGIKMPESIMTTNKFSGVFMEKNNLIREEFLHAVMKNGKDF